MTGSAYKRRWFVLDTIGHKLKYYREETGRNESGSIDLVYIVDIQPSKIYDAPQYAFDLISHDKYYTVAAFSRESMIKWAFAIQRALKVMTYSTLTRGSTAVIASGSRAESALLGEDSELNDALKEAKDRWYRYEYIYQNRGPLMLNVVGKANKDSDGDIVSYSIVVDSFECYPGGQAGVSELSGVIAIGDYVVGVNGVDLSHVETFQAAMEAVQKATWPKTLYFMRDNELITDVTHIEGWTIAFYPTLGRSRRRYITLIKDTIHFMRPEPSGAVSSSKEAFLTLNQISYLRPVTDMSMEKDRQHLLRLACKPGGYINIEQEELKPAHTVPVEVVDLYFPEMKEMQLWCQCLGNPRKRSTTKSPSFIPEIPVAPHETIDVVEAAKMITLGIKSQISGVFSPKHVSVVDGYLVWQAIQDGSLSLSLNNAAKRPRRMFIADTSSCAIREVKAIDDQNELTSGFQYQLVLQGDEQTITIGMSDKATLAAWLGNVAALVLKAPVRQRPQIPDKIEKKGEVPVVTPNGRSNSSSTQLVATSSTQLILSTQAALGGESAVILSGYLYKKHKNKLTFGLGRRQYSKYWFILRDLTLVYYKSNKDAIKAGSNPTGTIDISQASKVREAEDPKAPPFSLEVVTPSRVYTFIAEDDVDELRWYDAIHDVLETRNRCAPTSGKRALISEEERIFAKFDSIQQSIVYEGGLSMKKTNSLSRLGTWKSRYFVIMDSELFRGLRLQISHFFALNIRELLFAYVKTILCSVLIRLSGTFLSSSPALNMS